jgi:hypothetical protein
MIAGYTGLKAGDSNAIALLGAPSPTGANIPAESVDDLQYLQQLFALNGGQALAYFDAVSAHPNGFPIRLTARQLHRNAASPAASTTTTASLHLLA